MYYRRVRIHGGQYFFTAVTHNRKPVLCEPNNVSLLRTSIKYVMDRHPFVIDAFVLLPDHLHCLWSLPDGDADFSTRWRLIKSTFTRTWAASAVAGQKPKIWQNRFWEHAIRDDSDWRQHVDYIHYNPVKHGLVKSPRQWPHSSIHRFIKNGLCESDWGSPTDMQFDAAVGSE